MGKKGEETRKLLVRTARNLFRCQGFQATSIDDISRAAGINRGNLYFHFKNKEDLAAAALADSQERTFRFFGQAMADESDPLLRLRRMVDALVAFNAGENCTGG
ncbi:MAG: TetR/AcrR family transcriptional regulator [Deltaproteobacteria bacterium]|nr:TetR/AcrR family transcriptional regulator [Deltaproteobacteria bacterium]